MMKKEKNSEKNSSDAPKDFAGVMIYGNLKIIDVNTGEILVNKRA